MQIKSALLKLLQHNVLNVALVAAIRGGAPTVAYNVSLAMEFYGILFNFLLIIEVCFSFCVAD